MTRLETADLSEKRSLTICRKHYTIEYVEYICQINFIAVEGCNCDCIATSASRQLGVFYHTEPRGSVWGETSDYGSMKRLLLQSFQFIKTKSKLVEILVVSSCEN